MQEAERNYKKFYAKYIQVLMMSGEYKTKIKYLKAVARKKVKFIKILEPLADLGVNEFTYMKLKDGKKAQIICSSMPQVEKMIIDEDQYMNFLGEIEGLEIGRMSIEITNDDNINDHKENKINPTIRIYFKLATTTELFVFYQDKRHALSVVHDMQNTKLLKRYALFFREEISSFFKAYFNVGLKTRGLIESKVFSKFLDIEEFLKLKFTTNIKFTKKELLYLYFLCRCSDNEEISNLMHISYKRGKDIYENIKIKTKINRKKELVKWFRNE